MNILFITRSQLLATKGGTERITSSIASALERDYGCKCFSAYYLNDTDKRVGLFENREIQVNKHNISKKLSEYIFDNGIEWVICQGEFEAAISLRKHLGDKVGIVLAHHFQPGWEQRIFSYRNAFMMLRYGSAVYKKIALKQILFMPYFKIKASRFSWLYRKAYENVDRLVLLSEGFKNKFSSYAKVHLSDNKVTVIPNALSFNEFADAADLFKKKKRVLIVSRLDEVQKRISLSIAIWREIMQDSKYRNWSLEIVGNGPNRKQYEDIVKKHSVPNVVFKGEQIPQKFYLEDSIFMMTSKSEGWGLTLTEAQQFGCIPIAFNTYESLQDIIINGENGYIVEDSDVAAYVEHMKKLMDSEDLRICMMKNAIECSKRFNIENIGRLWFDLLSCQNVDK